MSTIFVKKLFEPWGKVYFGNSPDVDRIRCILRGRSGKYGRSSADYRRSFGFPGDGTDDVRVICAGRSALGRSGIAGMFLSWTLIIMTGFLAVILARTILIRSRFAGLLAEKKLSV